MSNAQVPGPLGGLRVLDLSRILAGPTCTQLLGDYGAEVIKIEKPGLGDDTRAWGPPYVTGPDGEPTAESAYYLSANRNKRSVAVDIATEEGAETVRQLARRCDILVENFKVGGLAKYGLDYQSLSRDTPGIVYCSITGFGQTGPNAHKPGYDLLAQGYGGIMSLTGDPEGEPTIQRFQMQGFRDSRFRVSKCRDSEVTRFRGSRCRGSGSRYARYRDFRRAARNRGVTAPRTKPRRS